MEFYENDNCFMVERNCFNSQRDGILRCLITSLSPGLSFNSQRDGILLLILVAKSNLTSVSIPNGMEFYRFRCDRVYTPRDVSIPNGMEFYLADENSDCKDYMFQFPTGWNSTIF